MDGQKTRGLVGWSTHGWGFYQGELTTPARFRYISTMKAPIQTGVSGRVTVPPEK